MAEVELPEELWVVVKAAADESGVPVDDFVNGLLRTYLEDNYGEV